MWKTFCAVASIALACGAAAAAEPIIDTIAGGGTPASGNGDGGQARQATLEDIRDIAFDKAGNLYVAEVCRIRKITPAGVITTIGGNGWGGDLPANGASAKSGAICSKTVAVDGFGNVWVYYNLRLGKIDPAGNFIYVAGTGAGGFTGDGGPATSASIYDAQDITFDAVGNAYFSDSGRVRKISTNGIITTIAGIGDVSSGGSEGDGGPATLARVDPLDLAFDRSGNLYFVDHYFSGIRKIDTSGRVTRISGAFPRYRSDPVALYTDPWFPSGLAFDANGNLFVANLRNYVSIISPANTITYAAVGVFNDTTWDDGPNSTGFEGDGGPVSLAKMRDPVAIAFDPKGNLHIADAGNARIRKVTGTFDPPPPVAAGTGMFQHAMTQRLESQDQYTVGIVKGHSNADNLDDLFVLAGAWSQFEPYPGDYRLYAYRQKPDGTMAAPLATPVPTMELTDVIAIDLNHDAYTDIVFSGYHFSGDGTQCIYVMLGSPAGMRLPVAYTGISGANGAFRLDQADMNGDGHMDVLARLSTGGDGVGTFTKWAIYYGNGTGLLVRKKLTSLEDGGLVHDMNGDGRPDMLAGVAVAYHDGVDSFLPYTNYAGPGDTDNRGGWPTVGDFDNDGHLDIVMSSGQNAPWAKLMQWSQKADGSLAFVREWPTYDIPQTLLTADMNGDGLDDLLVKHVGWSAIGYQEQKRLGGNTFGLDREVKSHMSVGNQSQPHSMVVGDFNNDHCLDIAGSGTNSGLQIIYSTRCRRVMPGAKPPLPPKRPVTTLTAAPTTPPVSASPTPLHDVWAASQKYARATWTSSVGAWSGTMRWIGAGFALLFVGWWVLAPSAFGRRRS